MVLFYCIITYLKNIKIMLRTHKFDSKHCFYERE